MDDRPSNGDVADVEPIAVIGMACRVPGAGDVNRFWHNLVAGVEARTELDRDRMLSAGASSDEVDDPAYVRVGFLLDDVETFDAGLFGLTPKEAALADPQHRIFLELCHSVLEDAGWDPARFSGDVGVYGGRGMETYRWQHVYRSRSAGGVVDHTTVGIGNHADTFTTLVSYRLNLTGPSVGLYTACSTSLVAVHAAAEALRAGECDMALAGGVTVELPADRGYLHREGGVESADGHCRPFDAAATGTVWGSGGGAVLLKRLSDALADGDHVRAVIIGNAVNNDGAGKVGFTAPSVDGQAAVIANALAVAGAEPRSISYVEAHGTATALGDPIEVAALTSAFGRDAGARQWCALGSVKSNIGHLSQGAGVVGLIKTVLSLEHELIPASLGYSAPNPAIDFADTPFYVNATLAKWEREGGPRRAGVSSFGIGGTNAHVVLEEAPATEPSPAPARPAHLLQLSARSAPALDAALTRLADHLTEHGGLDLADVAYTLRAGRAAHPHRAAVVAADVPDAIAALRAPKRRLGGVAAAPPRVVFLFSGQGAQYAGMGAALYDTEPVYAAAVDRCADLLTPDLGEDLRTLLLAGPDQRADADARLVRTALAQPALFTVGYALAELWRSWGVQPAATIGHSVGEYVAATLAGVFDLPAALRLVAARGRLMQRLPAGAMLAVAAPADTVAADLPGDLSIAAVNGPGTCVVAGPTDTVERFAANLADRRVTARRLRTSHAFHSAMMEPILAEFAAEVAAARPGPPRATVLSNRTSQPLTAQQATDPAYWVSQLREAVRFGDCVARALADGAAAPGPTLLLECGPGRQLAGLAQMQVPRGAPPALHSLPGPNDPAGDVATCYAAAGRLWAHGVALDPDVSGRATRVPLPAYPYERARHWIDPDPVRETPAPARRPLDEWFAVPGWRRLPPVLAGAPPRTAVVFAAGDALAGRLRAAGTKVVTVLPGDRYARLAADRYTVRADQPADYAALARHLGGGPHHWVYAWTLADDPSGDDATDLGFFAPLHLIQGLAVAGAVDGARVDLLTAGAFQVLGTDTVHPEHAMAAGVVRCAPLDVPGVRLRHIDLADPADPRLVAELSADPGPETVALRGGFRWAPRPEPVTLPAPAEPSAGLRDRGVYLVTGGLGALGLAVAEDLARRARAHVVLIGRSATPEATERITAAGGTAESIAADVTDPAALHRVREHILARYGRLDGIVHAAGVADGGLTETRARPDMLAVLAPKVAGTLALREIFGDLPLDFVALFSSTVGTTGGLGEVDYCAANAWLDAYAQSRHGWTAPVLSLGWAGWRDAGMFARATADMSSTVDLTGAMTAAEGVAAFHRAISAGLDGHLLISPLPVSARPAGDPAGPATTVDAGTGRAAATTDPRPSTQAGRAAQNPVGGVERELAGIWSSLLGAEDIGPDDDFFTLGGNSLLAVQLIAQVRKAFAVRLPMRSVFDTPTVAGMAARVAHLRAGREQR